MITNKQDAFGHALWNYHKSKIGAEIVEREDGLFDNSGGPKAYFTEYDEWDESEREAIEYARGKVLDIGCGAGRHSLHLQNKGHDVTGIDNSPLAVKVCRERGLRNVELLSVTSITSDLGLFDTITMFGNNFSLIANLKRAGWLLKKFHRITSEKGRIIAHTLDPYQTNDPDHLEYQEYNRKRGRMPGQVKIRIRYRKYVTPWFDYLFLSQKEMTEVLENTGWSVTKFIDGKNGIYLAIIDKA